MADRTKAYILGLELAAFIVAVGQSVKQANELANARPRPLFTGFRRAR